MEMGQPAAAQTARDLVGQAVERGDIAAVELLVALTEGAPVDSGPAAVGYGPLENLLHDHGDALIDAIESNVRQHPAFAQALAVAQIERGHVSDATEKRLAPWVARFTSNR